MRSTASYRGTFRITTRDGRRVTGEQTTATRIDRGHRAQTLRADTITIVTSVDRVAFARATDTTVVVGVRTKVSGNTGGDVVVAVVVAMVIAPESEGNHQATVSTVTTHTSRILFHYVCVKYNSSDDVPCISI